MADLAITVSAADALRRAEAGELLGPEDICAIWHIGRSRFWQMNKAHAFDHLRVVPAIGPRCFSGRKVWRYVNGEPVFDSTFGRKSGTR